MNQSGLTLLELVVTLAVLAIMLTIAIPGFTAIIHASRLSTATNDMVAALHLARSEAIKRNGRAVLCKSADGLACSASGGWDQGWMVFHDANNNAALDAGETSIRTQSALPNGLRLTGNSPVSHYISYAPTGATKQSSGALQMGTLTLCQESTSSVEGRQIIISRTGRPRTKKVSLSACP